MEVKCYLAEMCLDDPKKVISGYLEDHPMTCKWLGTMVIVRLSNGAVGPLTNGLNG